MRWRLGGGRAEDDEPQELDEEPEVEEEPEEEAPASLDALDEETRAIAERYAAAQLDAERAKREKLVAGARAKGLMLDEEGNIALGDISAASAWMAPLFPVAGTPAAQHPTPNTQPAPEPEDPEPDASYDLQAWLQWSRRQNERDTRKLVAESTKALQEENQRLLSVVSRREQTAAASEIRELVKEQAPHFEQYLQHPDFARAYQQGLSRFPAEALADPTQLLALVAVTAMGLDPSKAPAADPPAEAPRDTRGRFTGREQALHDLQRVSVGATTAPRDAGAATTGSARSAPLSRVEEAVMGQFAPYLGNAPQAVWAEIGACENIEQYQAMMARHKGRR